MQNELTVIKTTILKHNNNFQWQICAYEDVTEIVYSEFTELGNLVNKKTFEIPAGMDLQVFEEAIKLRKSVEKD